MSLSTGTEILDLDVGSIVAGKYEVLRCLGLGRMGIVYLCQELHSPYDFIAFKVLAPLLPVTESFDAFLTRFKHEISSTSLVNHPNVVRTYEYIQENALIGFSMEYVPGENLASYLEKYPSPHVGQTINILMQLCRGVEAIHRAGIIHRDLKPANILISESGLLKISDFGTARTEEGPKITARGSVVGTIQYLSPQYLEDGFVSEQGDIYALGTIAYELITGVTPYPDQGMFKTIEAKITTDPVAPNELNRDCPRSLSAVIMKSLHRDLRERYHTAAEMERALRPIAGEYPALPLLVDSARAVENGELRGPRGYPLLEKPIEVIHSGRVGEGVSPVFDSSSMSPSPSIPEPIEIASSLSLGTRYWPIFDNPARPNRWRMATLGSLLILCSLFLGSELFNSLPGLSSPLNVNDSASVHARVSAKLNEQSTKSLSFPLAQMPNADLNARLPELSVALPQKNVSRNRENVLGSVTQSEMLPPEPVNRTAKAAGPSSARGQVVPPYNENADSDDAGNLASPKEQVTASSSSADPVQHRETSPRQYALADDLKIKGTLLYRFADYLVWPPKTSARLSAPLSLCVVGENPFGTFLADQVGNVSRPDGRRLMVRTIPPSESQIRGCNIVYAAQDFSSLEGIVRDLKNSGTVVISDGTGKGAIDFVLRDKKIKFNLDLRKLRSAGVGVKPILVDLAVEVIE